VELSKSESCLTLQRAQLMHYFNTAVHFTSPCSTMDHTTLDSMMEKYSCDESEYRMGLETFWDLTQKISDNLKAKNGATNFVENEEVTDSGNSHKLSPYLHDDRDDSDGSTYASSRRYSESANCMLSDNVSISESHGLADSLISGDIHPVEAMKHRSSEELGKVHDVNTVKVRVLPGGSVKSGTESKPEPVVKMEAVSDSLKKENEPLNVDSSESKEEQFPALPRSKPVAVPVPNGVLNYKRNRTAAVKNNLVNTGYKYRGRGFGIWKQNHGRAIHTTTELHCTKTCGKDVDRLKKYFVAKGGFEASQIRKVRFFEPRGNNAYSRVFVRGTMESIETAIEKMNAGKEKKIVSLAYMRWNKRTRKLIVKNFDILTEDDHRKFTKLFLKFGDLDCDLVMRKNNDGVNYAFVTYKLQQDARDCERSQNDAYYRKGDALVFNGRELMIGYVNEEKSRN